VSHKICTAFRNVRAPVNLELALSLRKVKPLWDRAILLNGKSCDSGRLNATERKGMNSSSRLIAREL